MLLTARETIDSFSAPYAKSFPAWWSSNSCGPHIMCKCTSSPQRLHTKVFVCVLFCSVCPFSVSSSRFKYWYWTHWMCSHQVFNKQWNGGSVYWLFSSGVSFWLNSLCSLSEEVFRCQFTENSSAPDEEHKVVTHVLIVTQTMITWHMRERKEIRFCGKAEVESKTAGNPLKSLWGGFII